MIRRLAILLVGILALVSRSEPAAGQIGPATGSRVRVTAPAVLPERVVGRVAAATADSLLLSVARGSASIALDKAAIERLQVSRGRARFRWAVLGAGVGFFGGAVIGGAIGGHGDDTGWGAMAGTLAGAAIGLPAGAVAGALLAPERWAEYHLPRTP